jgi:hypothetical protein
VKRHIQVVEAVGPQGGLKSKSGEI